MTPSGLYEGKLQCPEPKCAYMTKMRKRMLDHLKSHYVEKDECIKHEKTLFDQNSALIKKQEEEEKVIEMKHNNEIKMWLASMDLNEASMITKYAFAENYEKSFLTIVSSGGRDETISILRDDLMQKGDIYTQWDYKTLTAFGIDAFAEIDPDVRFEILQHPAVKKRSDKETEKGKSLIEVDHIWEVQLFTCAMSIVELHIPSKVNHGFTIRQLIFIRDLVNNRDNLTATLHTINRKKGKLMEEFIKKYKSSSKLTMQETLWISNIIITNAGYGLFTKSLETHPLEMTSDETTKTVTISENIQNALSKVFYKVIKYKLSETMKGTTWTDDEKTTFSCLVKVMEHMLQCMVNNG